jgi:hypothetical protein
MSTMTVAASIILAAIVGGLIFVLLDSWQRRTAAVAQPEPEPVVGPEPPRPVPVWDQRRPEGPQDSLWSGWAGRRR